MAIRPEPQGAPDERQIDALEMAWITTSDGARLFRGAAAARGDARLVRPRARPLHHWKRGVLLHLPRALRAAAHRHTTDSSGAQPREACAETLALIKMNWNQTRLDGQLSVTLRSANKVKAMLRFCPA